MIPDPMHPAIVHFPIVFAVLLPVVTILALGFIQRGAPFRRTWLAPAVLAVGLAVASFAAVRTGEAQEERVEEVVAETPMHSHEEAGERFLLLSALVAGVSLLGLARGNVGAGARWVSAGAALVVLVAGYQVGHSGGALVYQHGAASAYATRAESGEGGAITVVDASADEDDDRD